MLYDYYASGHLACSMHANTQKGRRFVGIICTFATMNVEQNIEQQIAIFTRLLRTGRFRWLD